MPGTSPPGEAEGKGPSAYIVKQATTTQHVTTGAGLPPVNHMSAARRDAKSCVAHGGRDPKGLPHGAGQTAGERNGHDPDVRLPGSPHRREDPPALHGAWGDEPLSRDCIGCVEAVVRSCV